MDRRSFLWSAALVSARKPENVYRFRAAGCDVRMNVAFYDRYASAGFWFGERRTDSSFCLSASGETGRGCLKNFRGSLAIARYHISPHAKLREQVRTIDRDGRLTERPPFERTLSVVDGVVSDIQAFGYEDNGPSAEGPEPWCFLRQDLYFEEREAPFLTIHWKHTWSAIRLLDVIPGGTP
ncbi:MAG TPA: hypothetical protein VK493_11610 [Bryobacteraceae bacterium]|nr:hypothetical protein [Bryobacteraceae bacterium]